MASNTTSSVGSPPTRETSALVVRRTDTVSPETRVRHFDELSDELQQAVAEYDGGKTVVPMTPRLANEVTTDTTVVFTDYYRVTVV
ncbi:hypothetical protein [Haladaptatus halobius]|uniref:hypothetical protein n=1 Tax=Haladaptatus halobius TaxID=2884875 RepID=UPI001D0AD087|nr:hypothetical protein [Haladaptatus halobius]